MEATTGTVLAGAGAAGIVIGSVGPWATVTTGFGTISANGTSGDGTITLILGIAVAVMVLFAAGPKATPALGWVTAAIAGGALAVAVYDIQNVSRVIRESSSSFATASVGWGLYVCAVGAGVAVAGGAIRAGELKKAAAAIEPFPPPPPPPPA